jgi:hypothetical protein
MKTKQQKKSQAKIAHVLTVLQSPNQDSIYSGTRDDAKLSFATNFSCKLPRRDSDSHATLNNLRKPNGGVHSVRKNLESQKACDNDIGQKDHHQYLKKFYFCLHFVSVVCFFSFMSLTFLVDPCRSPWARLP